MEKIETRLREVRLTSVSPSYSWMSCQACGKADAASKCSQCREVSYCSPACQKSDWSKHKMSCLPQGPKQRFFTRLCRLLSFLIFSSPSPSPSPLSIAKALEIAILGRASPTACESVATLSRCFKESAGSKDPALARLRAVLTRCETRLRT